MPEVFGKSELIAAVHERAGGVLHMSEVERIIDALAAVVREKAAGGMTVSIPGLGRFAERTRAARSGRNPATGEPIASRPASRSVSSRPSPSPEPAKLAPGNPGSVGRAW